MNDENAKLVREAVKEAGDFLQDKLPPHPSHAKRNAYAHLWRAIKEEMGRSYKDCENSDLPAILAIIKRLRDNPS
jgi:hypothetical protein